MKQLVLASNNAGKLRELNELLAPLGIQVLPQSELGITEAEEPFLSFVENALTKARHAARVSGLPALADDSGICVVSLQGQPGVHSARFAGEPKSDLRNNEKLVGLLQDRQDRRAHYYCAVVMVRHADDPEPLIAEGRWQGLIIDTPRGKNGFGYDPHFLVPELGLTAAELDGPAKHALSHRGQALRRLLAMLPEAR